MRNNPEQTRSDNYCASFFEASYSGKRVLVLAPHQDDEINLAAGAIPNFLKAGAEVFVAYSTNGDYSYSADTRLTEAVNSLTVLGLNREHIFILGYGDTFNYSPSGHIFYSDDEPVKSHHGVTQTYGGAGFSDFAYITRKEHSTYTRKNFLHDIKSLLLHVKADVIICVDFDNHPDHRMLSLSFERVMGEILSRPGNDYRPEVFKRFAYSTAMTAVPDLYADNLRETQKPTPAELIDTSCCSWRERVRLPVPEESRKPFLAGNMTAEALACHESQAAIYKAERVINSDEVFFQRRTDSLTFSAHVRASSGNPDYAHDFMLLNVSEIDSDSPVWTNYLWQPESGDSEKRIVFTWDNEQTISRVRLWGNVDGTPIQNALLETDNGCSVELGKFPEHGLPVVIDIPADKQQGVRQLSVKILDGRSDCGLAEVEAFPQREYRGVIRPFVQILAGDNFAYTFNRKPEQQSIPVGCYCFGVNEPVNWSVMGNAVLEDGSLVFHDDSDVIVRAEAGGAYCQAVFHTLTKKDIENHQRLLTLDRKYLARYRRRVRSKYYLRTIKEQGIFSLVKHMLSRIIDKLGGRE